MDLLDLKHKVHDLGIFLMFLEDLNVAYGEILYDKGGNVD